MSQLLLRLLTLLLLCAPLHLAAAEFVKETFSGLFAGQTIPSTRWNIAGGSFTVQDTPSHRAFGPSSLFGRINGANARVIATTSIPTTGLTVISFTFREPSGINGQSLIFGLGKSGDINTTHAGLAFQLDDGVLSTGSNTIGPTASYPLDVARNITVVFNRGSSSINYTFQGTQTLAAAQADVWISQTTSTAVPAKVGTFTSTANTTLADQFILRTFSVVPGNVIDIDNISIRDTISPATLIRSSLYPAAWQPPQNSGADFQTGTFLQDFSQAGYRAGDEEPPTIATPEWVVTAPPFNADPTGNIDSTTAIQNAINVAEAAGGGVVRFPPGTYRVRPQSSNAYALRIDARGVVLRGDSPATTRIFNDQPEMRNKQVILVQGPSAAGFTASAAISSLITTNLLGPVTQIPVANAALFSPGSWVTVRSDATDAWVTEHNVSNWIGQGASLGGLAYRRQVVSIDTINNLVTIDIPTRYTIKTRDNARLQLAGHSGLDGAGIENLSIGMLELTGTGWGEEDYNSDTKVSWHAHASYAITFQRTRDCWMRNVHSYHPSQNITASHLLSNGVLLADACRITLMDCHFQQAQYGGGGGNGYLYRLTNAQDCLLIRCRATYCRHAFVFSSMRTCGNVFHRCIDSITGHQVAGGPGTQQTTSGRGSDHHMHFSHSNLVDTCVADSSYFTAAYRPYGSTPLHEVTSSHGVFWNTEGTGTGGAVVETEQSRMGYAIGSRGTRNTISRPTGGGSRMAPADWVEAQNSGDRLEPFSLYEDQLQRRLGPLYLTPIELWRRTYFGVNAENPEISGNTIDSDNDGRTNMLEFALNHRPDHPQDNPRTFIRPLAISGNVHQTFTLPVRDGAIFQSSVPSQSNAVDGLIYTVQSSTDLVDWTTVEVVQVASPSTSNLPPLDAGWTYRTFATTLPPATTQRLFYRVVITALPE